MLVIGHRGCRGLFPENTIDACLEAIRLGVHAIELDVVVSKDNEIVVSHEPYMSRTICLFPNGMPIPENEDQQINLYKLDYAKIKEFDCGLKTHPKFLEQINIPCYKPLLSEVLVACEKYTEERQLEKTKYIIEVKSRPEWYGVFYPEPAEYIALLLKELALFSFNDRVVLKSFDVAILNEINKQDSSIPISLLINKGEVIKDKLKTLHFKPQILGPYYQLLSKKVVQDYQEEGYLLFPWTVNQYEDIKIISAYGVDGLITDYPNRVLA